MIRPTFLAFETAKKALASSQAGLDTVGHNISNVNTLGYTRQRVDQVSLSTNGMSMKYQVFGSGGAKVGNGVNINSISQIRDPYLDNRYRNEASVNGQLAVRQDGLTDINNIFDETMSDGLSYKLDQLINYLDKFAESPDNPDYAAVVRSCANELASMISKSAYQLEEARAMQTSDLTTSVETDLNQILHQIADLNGKIKEENLHGNPANELNDERNMLIDRLSEYMDIQVTRTPVHVSSDVTIEKLSIELRDSGTPPLTLINSMDYNNLAVSVDEDTGKVAISLVTNSGYEIADLTQKLTKGSLKGYLDIINGSGPNSEAGENSFRGIPYYQNSLDEFAQTLAEVFNRVNNVTAEQAAKSGGTVSETFGFKNLFVPLTLDITDATGEKPAWIDSITSNALQFSGKTYENLEFKFGVDSAGTDVVTVEINGKTYSADYVANGKMEFYEIDPGTEETLGGLAFTINTTGVTPDASTITSIDAKINAKNITISSSWLENPLYITTSKEKPVTDAKPVLSIASGGAKPSWLNSVATGDLPDPTLGAIKNGDFVFTKSGAGTAGDPTMIHVKINGTTYSAEYKADAELKLTEPGGKVGMIIVTNHREFTSSDSANTVSIKNSTGAKSDNLQKLSSEIKAPNAYTVSGFKGSLPEFLVNNQRDMAMDKQTNTDLFASSSNVISEYADRRDSVSAVSIDEEGINMMTYQNYYNAAARYMSALDEALDKIINGMGTVGR